MSENNSSSHAAAWVEQLKAEPEAELVICDTCPTVAACPPLGIPDGWDGVWSRRQGWIFTCPGCLDKIEADYHAGGGYLEARRRLGGAS